MPWTEHLGRAQKSLHSERYERLERHGISRRFNGFGSSHTVVVYPPLAQLKEIEKNLESMADDFPDESSIDLYVHIPLCEFPCPFCHYSTSTAPKGGLKPSDLEFLDVTLKELATWKAVLSGNGRKLTLGSFYLGGGTGFFLNEPEMELLVDKVLSVFSPAPDFSFCVEASTVSLNKPDAENKLNLLKTFGLNRVSIGVQSIDEELLRTMGRRTSTPGIGLASVAVQKASQYVDTVNVDLLQDSSAGYDVETMFRDLEWFVKSGASSLTFYVMRSHPGSRLYLREQGHEREQEERRRSAVSRLTAINYLLENGFVAGPGGRFHKHGKHDPYKLIRGTQKATLLGIGQGAYSRIGEHQFRWDATGHGWRNQVAQGNIRRFDYHFVSKEEIIEGNLIKLVREKFDEPTFNSLVSSHSSPEYRDQVQRLFEYLKKEHLLENVNGFLQLAKVGLVFEEEICWLLHSAPSRAAAETVYSRKLLKI